MKVLQSLIADPGSSGADIGRATGMPSGTVYPILARLEDAGWLQSAWESGNPTMLGRPRRRFYHLTALGARYSREAAQQMAKVYAWGAPT